MELRPPKFEFEDECANSWHPGWINLEHGKVYFVHFVTVFCRFVNLAISLFGLESWISTLIAPVSGHCLLVISI